MKLPENQERLIKLLVERNTNRISSFTIMSKVREWDDEDIDKMIEYVSNKEHSIHDIINYMFDIDAQYSHEYDEVVGNCEESNEDKPFLYMCYDAGMVGVIKFEVRPTDADFFNFILWDFNIAQLPKDINDDEELERCAEDWCYPNDWIVDKYIEMRNIDYSKYAAVVVWNDMTPSSLMFLYTVCKFVKECDIFENNVSKFNFNPCRSFDEPDDDYTGVFDGMRLITRDLQKKFVEIYDRFAGKPMSAKIANGYDIMEVSDDTIIERILAHCTNEFKTAYKVAVEAQDTEDPCGQNHISFNYYIIKIFELTKSGMFEVKQKRTPEHWRTLTEPYMYNGVDISTANCYCIKLKG